MKKLISLLAVIALVAVLATAAFATEEPALVVDTVEAAAGDEVVINISIANNPGIVLGEMVLSYDETALEPVDLVPDDEDDEETLGVQYCTFTEDWKWETIFNPKNGFLAFSASKGKLKGDIVMFSLTFKVKEGTQPGKYPVNAVVDFIGDDDGDFIVGTTFTGYVVIPCNHEETEVKTENEVAATCTAEGSYDEVTYCTLCGEELKRETKTTEKAAHTPAEVVVENEVAASCTAEGSYDEVVYCSVCGEELSRETKAVEKLAHTPAEAVKENETDGTCLVKGSYDEVVYCSVCGTELSRTTVETELGDHVAGEATKENVVGADCKTPGSYDLVVSCTVCNEVLSTEHVEGELGDHAAGEVVIENVVAGADCLTAGSYDEVVYCTICGAELSRETKEGKLGEHGDVKFVDTGDGETHNCVCVICEQVLDNEDHTYGEFIDDPENEGWKYKVCEKCGYVHREGATPPPTGDNSMIAVVMATVSMLGIALVVSKKKEF